VTPITYQKFAQWSTDDGIDVEVHVLAVFIASLGFPGLQHGIVASVHFFDVVIHVLDEEYVIVECLLIFWIALALGGHYRRRLLSNDLQAFEHGFVHPLISVIDHASDLELLPAVGSRWQHILNCSRKVRERLHEGNDTFALLDLDFGILNGTYLLVEEAIEETLQSFVYLLQVPCQEVLVCVLDINKLSVDRAQNSNALPIRYLLAWH
jgi:hypothetical protein